MQFLLAGEEQFEAVYQFCQLMIRTDARMSFTDVTERSVLRYWYDNPAVQLYAAVDLPSQMAASPAAKTVAAMSGAEAAAEVAVQRATVPAQKASPPVVALFRAKRGVAHKAHSCDIACAVHPDYRRRNLATDLTLFALADQKERGVLIARTYVYSWNTASLATIGKAWFVEGGRVLMHSYDAAKGGWVDDVLFHKVLQDPDEWLRRYGGRDRPAG